VNYDEVRKSIAGILDAPTHDDGSLGPVFIRLAWHASGTYDKKDGSGGSNGATMRFAPESNHGANAGLNIARTHLEKIKAQYPDISYADLWTLAGVVAVEEMGGPKIEWRPGRSDAKSGDACPPEGRLPDAAQGAQHVRDIFYKMGFNDQEIVALAGAHCFGRCHTDRSGYTGPWTRAPTTFSNQFYTELLNNKWTPKKWSGPNQFEDPTGQLMMTPADMSFLTDPAFRKHVEVYAKDSDKFEKDFAKAYSKLLHLGVGGQCCTKVNFPVALAAVVGVAASSRFF
jgi:cytochrome c peroxidase